MLSKTNKTGIKKLPSHNILLKKKHIFTEIKLTKRSQPNQKKPQNNPLQDCYKFARKKVPTKERMSFSILMT